MKFIVDNNSQNSDQKVTLYLEQENDIVHLMAMDQEGGAWILLELYEDGHMNLISDISNDLGFNVDEKGFLIISKNE